MSFANPLLLAGLAVVPLLVALYVRAERRRGRSAFSVVAAAALLGGFGTIASGAGAGVAAFTTGIITALTWLRLLGVDTYTRATYARR